MPLKSRRPHPKKQDETPMRPPRPAGEKRRAILVGVALPGQPVYEAEEHLAELAALADTAGVVVAGQMLQARKALDPKYFIGSGKAEEVAREAEVLDADLVLFDDDLSGGQVKNLEKVVKVQVMDRSGLILEIFDQRARSREARTQVELARLQYLLPRLTRQWQHLSRQVGGIGVRGGEGETQLEADRRVLGRRIAKLKVELAQIDRMRKEHRRGRSGVPVVSLAGYTNAGKSTLFNRLTRDTTLAEDRLFATLDPRLRRGYLPPDGNSAKRAQAHPKGSGAMEEAGTGNFSGHEDSRGRHDLNPVLFSDTVGFIRKLPHHLVASFRSTLDEIAEADLILHVIDRSHPRWDEQKRIGEEVMADLGIDPGKILEVHNKVDRFPPGDHPPSAGAINVSALTGEGLDELRARIARRLARPKRADTPRGLSAASPVA
jgi:GTP-binding protein HflX